MSFTLLQELYAIKERSAREEAEPLLESVETLLQVLVAKVKNRPEAFLEHIDIEELAAQLGGLVLLGKAEHRAVIDDFAKLDDKKLSENLFKFLRDIAEPHADRIFDEGLTADKFLIYIGNVHAKSLTQEWKDVLLKAKEGDQEALKRISNALVKLNEFYSAAYRKLSSAYDHHASAVPAMNAPAGLDSAIDALST
jgi:hypothetical protein